METVTVAGQPLSAPDGEAALIRAAQQQNHDAFEQLVRCYDRSVLRLAFNVLRSEEDARDAYQEVFLRVYRHLGAFNHQSSFHTWLYRIATNVCLDMLRRRRVRREQPAPYDPETEQSSLLDREPDVRVEADPDRVLSGRRLASVISVALEELSPKERAVFELRHYEGLRLRVIGDLLCISEEAAKNCLFRATRKLRRSLQGVSA